MRVEFKLGEQETTTKKTLVRQPSEWAFFPLSPILSPPIQSCSLIWRVKILNYSLAWQKSGKSCSQPLQYLFFSIQNKTSSFQL
jgi:hypothetical protein